MPMPNLVNFKGKLGLPFNSAVSSDHTIKTAAEKTSCIEWSNKALTIKSVDESDGSNQPTKL